MSAIMCQQKTALVIVLGDAGRSPRMQYHTTSLLDAGYSTTLLGYTGSDLIPSLTATNPNFTSQRFNPSLPFTNAAFLRRHKLLLPFYYLARLLTLISMSIYHGSHTTHSIILLQNPPSLPTILIAYILSIIASPHWFSRSTVIIDWHNIGYTMVPDHGPVHTAIRTALRWYEILASRLAAHHNLTVTYKMKEWLGAEFGLQGNVTALHDKPPKFFTRTTPSRRRDLFAKLGPPFASLPATTKILFSSTSWTPDEDFGLLLNALVTLDERTGGTYTFPEILCVVTGKGPQKAMYEEKFEKLNLGRIKIMTVWLESGDYPVMVGCADLGVSLHTSTR